MKKPTQIVHITPSDSAEILINEIPAHGETFSAGPVRAPVTYTFVHVRGRKRQPAPLEITITSRTTPRTIANKLAKILRDLPA
jgi:hypothetical protein